MDITFLIDVQPWLVSKKTNKICVPSQAISVLDHLQVSSSITGYLCAQFCSQANFRRLTKLVRELGPYWESHLIIVNGTWPSIDGFWLEIVSGSDSRRIRSYSRQTWYFRDWEECNMHIEILTKALSPLGGEPNIDSNQLSLLKPSFDWLLDQLRKQMH